MPRPVYLFVGPEMQNAVTSAGIFKFSHSLYQRVTVIERFCKKLVSFWWEVETVGDTMVTPRWIVTRRFFKTTLLRLQLDEHMLPGILARATFYRFFW